MCNFMRGELLPPDPAGVRTHTWPGRDLERARMKGRRPHSRLRTGAGAGEDRGPGTDTRGRTKAARVQRLSLRGGSGKGYLDKDGGGQAGLAGRIIQTSSVELRAGRSIILKLFVNSSVSFTGRYWPGGGVEGKVPTLYMRT